MSLIRNDLSVRCFYLGLSVFALLGTIVATLAAAFFPQLTVAIFALWSGLFLSVALWSREYGANLCGAALLVPLTLPGPGETVLFVAPHPDDETLAAFTLLRRACASGAKVKLVFLTNGESFIDAAVLCMDNYRFNAQSCREFAARRQDETLAAARQIGLAPEDVFFLGFPDGGLEPMCGGNWSETAPYVNFFSKYRHTDFPGSYQPGTPYTQAGLLKVLTGLIGQLQPTLLVLPHPGDAHPDHRTTCGVAQEAALLINKSAATKSDCADSVSFAPPQPCRQLHYLVHYPNWPAPWSWSRCLCLVPPRQLLDDDASWENLVLSPEEIAAKGAAIESYASQVCALAPLMRSFKRRNELFCRFNNQ